MKNNLPMYKQIHSSYLNIILYYYTTGRSAKEGLHAENLLRLNNIDLLHAVVQLGKMLQNAPSKDCMAADDVFHK